MITFAQGTVISRLRLRASLSDPLAARLRLSSALDTADLSPAGLPAAAIVFIRALQDPLPGRLQLVHDGHMPPAWREAVAHRIEAVARTAAHPADGFVSSNAEAVYFSDRGELLACLARDWCAGTLGARWWWRSLLRDADGVRVVLAEWLRSPEYVPTALQQLAPTGEAASFVHRLGDDSTNALLERVIERFGLTHLRVLVNGSTATSDNFDEVRRQPRESPWLPRVPEAGHAGLTRKQANLIGVALLLHRAPSVARSAALGGAVARWMMPITPHVREMQPHVNRPKPAVIPYDDHASDYPTGAQHTSHDAASNGAERGDARPTRASKGNRERTDHPAGPRSDGVRETDRPLPNDSRIPAPPVILPLPAETQSSTAPIPQTPPDTRGPGGRAPERQAAAGSISDLPPTPVASDAEWIETRYGGALYLINLALFLELYGDFSSPARPGIDLSIWDFIALLGEALIGRAIHRDPLWPLLADLAGRHVGDPPGADYTPADEWRMPEPWIAPFAESGEWQWSVQQRRLRVWHPDGFAVLDVATRGRDHPATLAEELAPYRASGWCIAITRRRAPVKSKRTTRVSRTNPALGRWFGRLLPYVRARLKTALGTAETSDAGRLVCAGRARLQVTATHLEAYFALADLPIEVRLAGLDRDPGWVPAAGRYLRFHFD